MKKLGFCLMIGIFSFLLFSVEDPGIENLKVINKFQAVEQVLDASVGRWTWASQKDDPKGFLPPQTFRRDQVMLQCSIQVPPVFADRIKAGEAPIVRLHMRCRGRSKVGIQIDGRMLKQLVIDGASGLEVEEIIELELQRVGDELKIEVENQGFDPARGQAWPERRRPFPDEKTYFTLVSAEWVFPAISENLRELRTWLDSFQTVYSLLNPELVRRTFTGKPFPISDKRRTSRGKLTRLNSSLYEAVGTFDLEALRTGNWAAVKKSMRQSYANAADLRKYVSEYTLYLIGNAHIDIAWLWRMAETKMVARNTFDTILNNMSEYPELHFAQSQALAYEWMEKEYPDVFERIRQKVREGKWEIVGGMWVEPDCNLISGESMVRQILLGKNYFREKFGIDVRIGWNPDSFGYNWNMPQILKKSGFDTFITQKISWNDTTIFPYYIFWWQGVDGSRLLTYFPPEGYTANLRLDRTMKRIATYEALTGNKKSLILYGLGDHGGGPNREMLDRVRRNQKLPLSPAYIHAKAGDFLNRIRADLGDSIPVWNNELYLQYHRGTYTTQAATKRNNRASENNASTSEKLAAIACTLGFDYPKTEITTAWKTILTNQFHDILPGSSITPVYRDAAETYRQVHSLLNKVRNDSLSNIASKIDTAAVDGLPILVFNPLSWERNDFASLKIPGGKEEGYRLFDSHGREVPVEERKCGGNETEISFVAEHVPSIGYRVYYIREGKSEAVSTDVSATGDTLENNHFRLEFNPRTGNIRSLFSKTLDRELIPEHAEANALEVWEDIPEDWDAWNLGYTGRVWNLDKADSARLVSLSPVRAVYRVKKNHLGLDKSREFPTEDFPSSFFTQEIVLYQNLDRIDIHMEADWWETHACLKVKFPTVFSNDTAAFEIPFGSIRRPARFDTPEKKAQYESAALKWGDLSGEGGGFSLLNDCKYGYSIEENTLRLSLLRAPVWPDPTADRGRHTFAYSLYPHRGDWNDADTVRRGYELNTPLIAIPVDRHPGSLPAEGSFFAVKSDGVILETVKQAEKGGALIFRLYESKGKQESLTLKLIQPVKEAWETDLMESNTQPLKFTGRSMELEFKPFEIRTLKIILQ